MSGLAAEFLQPMSDKVALLCSGLGRVNRGYEHFADQLFNAIRERVPVVLFRGAGVRADREVVVGGWHRDGRVAASLQRVSRDRFFWEAISFGVLAWPRILRGRFKLLHYSEPPLNALFSRLERAAPYAPRRLFSHGVSMDPEHCLGCHHLHQVSQVAYQQALDFGIPQDRMTLLPYGIDTSPFKPRSREARLQLRKAFELPLASPVALCVAALNREHKRVDFLVRVFAELKLDCHLILCGKIEDETVIAEAKQKLGKRVTHLYVNPGDMRDIYALADLFVLPSLEEGLPNALLEASVSGLPVVVHDSALFRWILGPGWQTYADMSSGENLVSVLRRALGNLTELTVRMQSIRCQLVERFDWLNLLPRYLEMYQRALNSPPETIAQAMGRS